MLDLVKVTGNGGGMGQNVEIDDVHQGEGVRRLMGEEHSFSMVVGGGRMFEIDVVHQGEEMGRLTWEVHSFSRVVMVLGRMQKVLLVGSFA